ncbi:uncharacterized protein LOC112491226 isoform X2 [Ziziphus jujuba]|uniref:Uncharacterized protein LOC112491226 isoform X2 n=1 Tax=Ziziphus jujuba TaxID=326968 RepID=A0ABM3IKJ6_ZIZJJ|nr:uncharacterized protein LOC112491226 isoform X2 [Ziziphus jujuba]
MSSPFFTAADEFLPCFFSPTDNPALAASQVHRVYSVICHQNLKPISETFRLMITLCIKMKDKRQDQPNAKSLSKVFNPRRDEALSVFLIDPAKQ